MSETVDFAAEIDVQLSRADGTIVGVPHYSVIEERAHELGRQLSRTVQRQQLGFLVASARQRAKCPTCGTVWELQSKERPLQFIAIHRRPLPGPGTNGLLSGGFFLNVK